MPLAGDEVDWSYMKGLLVAILGTAADTVRVL